MEIKNAAIGRLKPNEKNPRTIKEDKFEKLVKSIKEFPEMLKIRPLVVDEDMVVLGGNMRLKACKEAGVKKVPYIMFTKEQAEAQNKKTGQEKTYEQYCKEFIIKDNVGFGEWDWDMIANEWESGEIIEWGLDVWNPEEAIDFSVLDDEEGLDSKVSEMEGGVKKAIQIEYAPEYYQEAYDVIKFWREQGGDVGMMILEHLKAEKEKL